MSVLVRTLGRLWTSTFLRLFVLALLIYNANLRSITSFDTNATRYLPISILREFDLDLDEFPFLHEYPAWALPAEADEEERPPAYWAQYVRGHYYPTFPVMPAILSVPVYAVPVWLGVTEAGEATLGLTRTEIVGTALSKLSASIAVALSVGFVYLTSLRLTTRRAALGIALIYGFATSSWSVTSQGLWQTALSEPLLALSLYCLVRAREVESWAAWSSILLALSVACRPPTIIFAMVLAGYVAHRHRRQLAPFAVAPMIIGALLLIHNLYWFDDVLGGYAATNPGQSFSLPSVERFLGLLVSPSRGLLVYSPVLVFPLIGLVISIVRRRDLLLVYTGLAVLLTILWYSAWDHWHGHFSYSYRHLVDVLPALGLFFPVVWGGIFRHRAAMALFAACIALSVLTQLIGVFCYPCDWYYLPVSASDDPGRFWDWGDPQMLRCLRAGPVDPDGLRLLRSMLGG